MDCSSESESPERAENEPVNPLEYDVHEIPEEAAAEEGEAEGPSRPVQIRRPSLKLKRRRLSTFESNFGVMDLESDTIGGSARSI